MKKKVCHHNSKEILLAATDVFSFSNTFQLRIEVILPFESQIRQVFLCMVYLLVVLGNPLVEIHGCRAWATKLNNHVNKVLSFLTRTPRGCGS